MIEYEMEKDSAKFLIGKTQKNLLKDLKETIVLSKEIKQQFETIKNNIGKRSILLQIIIFFTLSFGILSLCNIPLILSLVGAVPLMVLIGLSYETLINKFDNTNIVKNSKKWYYSLFKKYDPIETAHNSINEHAIELLKDPEVQREFLLYLKNLINSMPHSHNKDIMQDDLFKIVKSLSAQEYGNTYNFISVRLSFWDSCKDSLEKDKLIQQQQEAFLKSINLNLENTNIIEQKEYNLKTML